MESHKSSNGLMDKKGLTLKNQKPGGSYNAGGPRVWSAEKTADSKTKTRVGRGVSTAWFAGAPADVGAVGCEEIWQRLQCDAVPPGSARCVAAWLASDTQAISASSRPNDRNVPRIALIGAYSVEASKHRRL